MFHHISIGVGDLDRSEAFYTTALAPLGYVRLWRKARGVGYGPGGFEGEAPFAIVDAGAELRRSFEIPTVIASKRYRLDAPRAEECETWCSDIPPTPPK